MLACCFGTKKSRLPEPTDTQQVRLNREVSSANAADTSNLNHFKKHSDKKHSETGLHSQVSKPPDTPIVTRGDSEISLRWEPFVVDREDLDRELCARMSWNVSGKGAEQALIAVTKFKIMAARAHAKIEKRFADREHSPVVNSLRNAPVISAAISGRAVGKAVSGGGKGQLDAAADAELGQIQSREDKIDEGRRLLHQRLKLLKLREVLMEVTRESHRSALEPRIQHARPANPSELSPLTHTVARGRCSLQTYLPCVSDLRMQSYANRAPWTGREPKGPGGAPAGARARPATTGPAAASRCCGRLLLPALLQRVAAAAARSNGALQRRQQTAAQRRRRNRARRIGGAAAAAAPAITASACQLPKYRGGRQYARARNPEEARSRDRGPFILMEPEAMIDAFTMILLIIDFIDQQRDPRSRAASAPGMFGRAGLAGRRPPARAHVDCRGGPWVAEQFQPAAAALLNLGETLIRVKG